MTIFRHFFSELSHLQAMSADMCKWVVIWRAPVGRALILFILHDYVTI